MSKAVLISIQSDWCKKILSRDEARNSVQGLYLLHENR